LTQWPTEGDVVTKRSETARFVYFPPLVSNTISTVEAVTLATLAIAVLGAPVTVAGSGRTHVPSAPGAQEQAAGSQPVTSG
jgi:hypothetical protein